MEFQDHLTQYLFPPLLDWQAQRSRKVFYLRQEENWAEAFVASHSPNNSGLFVLLCLLILFAGSALFFTLLQLFYRFLL